MAKTKRGVVKEGMYLPGMDWWILLIVVILLLFLLGSIPLVLWSVIDWPARIIATGGLLITALYIIDTAFFTVYYLEKEHLLIISQLRHYFFPYRDMEVIKPGGFWSLVSLRSRKRFALAGSTIVIHMARGVWQEISLSPRNHQQFMEQLLKMVDHERSGRATLIKD